MNIKRQGFVDLWALLGGLLASLFFSAGAGNHLASSTSSSGTVASSLNENTYLVVNQDKKERETEFFKTADKRAESPSLEGESIVSSTFLEEGIVNDNEIADRDLIFSSTTTEMIIAVSLPPKTVNSTGDGYASDPPRYEPKDVAPIDPVGDRYAAWLLTAWVNTPSLTKEAILSATSSNIIVDSSTLITTTTTEIDLTEVTETSSTTTTEINTPTAESPIITNLNDHVVIFQITVGSASSTLDEFVELYNPTTSTIILQGYKLRRFTASGKTMNYLVNPFTNSSMIPPLSYFLIAHKEVASSTLPDWYYETSSSIAPSNTVSLLDQTGAVIDLVGFGEASIFETNPAPELKNDGWALSRDINASQLDTDNNAFDFHLELAKPHQNF